MRLAVGGGKGAVSFSSASEFSAARGSGGGPVSEDAAGDKRRLVISEVAWERRLAVDGGAWERWRMAVGGSRLKMTDA